VLLEPVLVKNTLSNDKNSKVYKAVLQNKNCPTDIYLKFVNYLDDEILILIARNAKDEIVFEELLNKSINDNIIKEIVFNQYCTDSIYKKVVSICDISSGKIIAKKTKSENVLMQLYNRFRSKNE
jgi:hypothetical protein